MTATDGKTGDVTAVKPAGKTKWKNKIKSFLTSPLPSSKPVAASISSESHDGYIGSQAYSNDIPVSESYEARLSKLVGDLEDADYGSTFASFGGLDSPQAYPYSALTPTNFSGLHAPIGVEDALSAFTAFGDYSFSDILVPGLEEAPTPSTSAVPASAPLSATQSEFSDASSGSTSSGLVVTAAQSRARPRESIISPFAYTANSTLTTASPLFPGDLAGTMVPFNSPADGLAMNEAGIASLSMPFSFEDLKGMGLIEGGGLDIGGDKEDDEFAELLRISQIGGQPSQGFSSASNSSGLGMGDFNLDLFPMPGVLPSPVTDGAGPSPALSYGESSNSNTSFEELGLDAHSGPRPSVSKKGLFSDNTFLAKSPSHTPKPSVASLPPTPASHRTAHSVPTSPHRPRPLPRIHASALQWRVAPTTLSPKSSIAVSPGRPMTKSPSFVSGDPYTSPSRLNRLNTASSPELKRRRESVDVGPQSIDAMLATHTVSYGPSQQAPARPIAGRRRVAGKMTAPTIRHSQSQQQLYQAPMPLAQIPQLPSSTGGWMTPDIVRNLYSQIDEQTFLCSLQGCHRTFGSNVEVEAHIQNHFASMQPQASVQQQGIWV